MASLKQALKEWAVAVDALEHGKTILLLRKGGLREQGGTFSVAHDQVLLYPTVEHQQPTLLKPGYAGQVQPVPSGWHPDAIALHVWARITHVFQVSELPQVEALSPFHIWNAQFVTERFHWKPKQPLAVLLLRIHQLPTAVTLPYSTAYGGCRSWIELAEPIRLAGSRPVLNEEEYRDRVEAIARCL